ncbi:hypothetical protein ACWGCI_10090 [Streptomyces sp. NPDC054949]
MCWASSRDICRALTSPVWPASRAPALAAGVGATTLAILLRGADATLWVGEYNRS